MRNLTKSILLIALLTSMLIISNCSEEDNPVDSSNHAPGSPSSPSPADNATDQALDTELSWQCTDQDTGDTLIFDIYFGLESSRVNIGDGQSGFSITPATLDSGTTYEWQVVAFDNHGDSTAGPVWSFSTVGSDTASPSDGIFAKLVVSRMIMLISGNPFRFDSYTASFDSSFAPCDPVNPQQPESVTCNDTTLIWNTVTNLYSYSDPFFQEIIELGGTYVYEVTASSEVPALTDSIDFPNLEPYITSPLDGDDVSGDGFEVTWAGSGGGQVELIIVSAEGDSTIWVDTENDGSYTFSALELSNLQPGEYGLVLNFYNRATINADGYDSRSFIAGRVMSVITLDLQSTLK